MSSCLCSVPHQEDCEVPKLEARIQELEAALGHLWSFAGGGVPVESPLGVEVRRALKEDRMARPIDPFAKDPPRPPSKMTDLERVRDFLEGRTERTIATARRGIADIDAHLKEDAEREEQDEIDYQAAVAVAARLEQREARIQELEAALRVYAEAEGMTALKNGVEGALIFVEGGSNIARQALQGGDGAGT